MNNLTYNEIRKWSIVALLSLIVWFAQGIYGQVNEIEARLRFVEQNQARIMGKMGIEPHSAENSALRITRAKQAP